jgi:DNA mismatch endonuclease (patch repair protein)
MAKQKRRSTPSYLKLRPASKLASKAASAASKKQDTKCEVALRRELQRLKMNFRINVSEMLGCPDFVFDAARLVVFADGDFWHGRRLKERLKRLQQGHNSEYWVRKIQSNVARDKRIGSGLRRAGWSVMRVWEGDIKRNVGAVTERIQSRIRQRLQVFGPIP